MVTVSFPVAAIKYPGKSGVREKGSLFVFPSQFAMVGKTWQQPGEAWWQELKA